MAVLSYRIDDHPPGSTITRTATGYLGTVACLGVSESYRCMFLFIPRLLRYMTSYRVLTLQRLARSKDPVIGASDVELDKL